MDNKGNNIELRSESVRNIIGQIPSTIIRTGISIIFMILIVLISLSIFFKYSYRLNVSIKITNENYKIVGLLKIPAIEFKKIKIGDKVIIMFNSNFNSNNTILINKVDSLYKEILITKDTVYNFASVDFQDEIISTTGYRINIPSNISCNAIIETSPKSFFYRLTSH